MTNALMIGKRNRIFICYVEHAHFEAVYSSCPQTVVAPDFFKHFIEWIIIPQMVINHLSENSNLILIEFFLVQSGFFEGSDTKHLNLFLNKIRHDIKTYLQITTCCLI